MARDDSQSTDAVVTEPTEAPVATTEPTEAPAATTETTEAAAPESTGPTEEELAANMSAYETALQAAVDAKDAQAEIPEAEMATLVTAFGNLSRKQRNQAEADLQEKIRDVLMGETMDVFAAKALATIQKALKGTKAKPAAATVAKVTVDPTREHIDACIAFYFAYQLRPIADGVKDGWQSTFSDELGELQEQIPAVIAYRDAHAAWEAADEATRGDEPTWPEGVATVLADALRLALGKGARKTAGRKAAGTAAPRVAFTGVRRDIAKHIHEYFAANPSTTGAKISAIAKFKSSEYPEGNASSGAISARFGAGKKGVPGVELVRVDNVQGLRQV
jgi:hypothetical protein